MFASFGGGFLYHKHYVSPEYGVLLNSYKEVGGSILSDLNKTNLLQARYKLEQAIEILSLVTKLEKQDAPEHYVGEKYIESLRSRLVDLEVLESKDGHDLQLIERANRLILDLDMYY